MPTLFVRHQVKDYAAWRHVYEDFDATRRGMGVTSDGVYQLTGNPNDITIYHEFKTMEEVQAFVGSAELHGAMERAGVVGAPDIWIAQRT